MNVPSWPPPLPTTPTPPRAASAAPPRPSACASSAPPPDTSSRSVSSIVAGNVFTLFNAIIGVFFVLILWLGLLADAAFGVIAIVNSYIGIRQELNAKKTLDELAVLVAPHAKVVRDGAVISLLAEEIVPGDVIAVEPGDQLVADGETIASRGMTLDESLLTGEADGFRKDVGERALSGSFCISGCNPPAQGVRRHSQPSRGPGKTSRFNDMDKDRNVIEIDMLLRPKMDECNDITPSNHVVSGGLKYRTVMNGPTYPPFVCVSSLIRK